MKNLSFYAQLVLILGFLVPHQLLQAQEIGIIPVKSPTSNIIYLIDGDEGMLIDFVEIKAIEISEGSTAIPPLMTINREEELLYVLTSHYGYKIDLKTSEILTEYQYMEVMEKYPGEINNPNVLIQPVGLTKDGVGFYSFNEKVRELQNEARVALEKGDYTASSKLSSESVKHSTSFPVSKVDINKQETTFYNMFDIRQNRPFLVSDEGEMHLWSENELKIQVEDIESQKILNEFVIPVNGEDHPELKEAYPGYPLLLTEGKYSISFYTFNYTTSQQKFYSLNYDSGLNEILSVNPAEDVSAGLNLKLKNSDQLYFGNAECNIGEMPAMPDFTADMPKRMTKKKAAKFNEEMSKKQEEHSKAMDEWSKKSTDITRCKLSIYSDPDLNTLVMEIPENKYGTLYNNRMIVTNNGAVVSAYDLENRQKAWSVDIDF